jgi:hypothetical protein
MRIKVGGWLPPLPPAPEEPNDSCFPITVDCVSGTGMMVPHPPGILDHGPRALSNSSVTPAHEAAVAADRTDARIRL